ncbi:glutamate synthase-related protein [Victivallis sp. Marseille-Q1083]|uniref:glutamate synthase-related protein n=1 Tax=Victivallis sp. Marseille-Q1083 TaxID=2717288 RepID=UPI001588BDE9|nr:glutamate synthase-related protein [Victivallis sp. Marseille-Q1083]
MAVYVCEVCQFEYDEVAEGVAFADLPADWQCPVCGAEKEGYHLKSGAAATSEAVSTAVDMSKFMRSGDDLESYMSDIKAIAESGKSLDEAMRTRLPVISWDDILIKGCQLSRLPLLQEETVATETVIGPNAKQPMRLETPIIVSHMSFGALSKEAKIALAQGSAQVGAAMCSGEGGILEESIAAAHRYIFEYVPNRYGVTPENLQRSDAVEIKFGQSAKPGMGGHLPGEKVTPEISAVRGFPVGRDILSPAHYADITSTRELKAKIDWLREISGGRPIGVKLAAGHIEEDLDFVLPAAPDFITFDGRPGGTGSAPKYIKQATSIPTIFALYRARKHLDACRAEGVSLIITGGLRISPDFAKALALGADAVAIATSALIALGCQQYRMCNSGRCPVGITSQDKALRANFQPAAAATRLANFLRVSTGELQQFARITGHRDVHELNIDDLCTCNSEISDYTSIKHV